MALVSINDEHILSYLQNIRNRRDMRYPNEMGPLFAKELQNLLCIRESDGERTIHEKSKILFELLDKVILQPSSIRMDKFWTLFQDNSLMVFEKFRSSCWTVYWNKIKHFLEIFLKESRTYAFTLTKFLEFSNCNFFKYPGHFVYMSIVKLCLEKFPEDRDCGEMLLLGITNFLKDTDNVKFFDKVHLLEHYVSSKSLDHEVVTLQMDNFLTELKAQMGDDFFCRKCGLGTVIRLLHFVGKRDFRTVNNMQKQTPCCEICLYGIRTAAAISFFEIKKGGRFRNLSSLSRTIATCFFKTATARPLLGIKDHDFSSKFFTWWHDFLNNSPEVDGLFNTPSSKFLRGCCFTDKDQECPLDNHLIFQEAEKSTDAPAEWKITDFLEDALVNDPSLRIAEMTPTFLPTEPMQAIEAPPQHEEPPPDDEDDSSSSHPTCAADQSENYRATPYSLRPRKSATLSGKKKKKVMKSPKPSPKAILKCLAIETNSGLNPEERLPISAKPAAPFHKI